MCRKIEFFIVIHHCNALGVMNDMNLIQYTPLLLRYPWKGYHDDKLLEPVVRGAEKSKAGDSP